MVDLCENVTLAFTEFRMATGSIQVNSTKKTGTITPKSGFTISESRCVQSGNIVEVHFYVSGNFTADTGVQVATISGVALPPTGIRKVCAYGAQAYSAWNSGYCGLFTGGEINVAITATGTRIVLLDFVYTVD